jgi:hypothetical protein
LFLLTTPHQHRPSCSTSGAPTDTTLIPIENTNKLTTHKPHLRLGFERGKNRPQQGLVLPSHFAACFSFQKKGACDEPT